MKTRSCTTVAIAALAAIVVACGEADDVPVDDGVGAETEEQVDDATDAAETDATVDLAVAASPLGDHLVTADGMTIYLFTEDVQGESVCTDDCLESWPAVTVDGEPQVDDGVDPDLVGTIDREDTGETQLTYAGLPLYLFAADAAPGDVEGQGVNDVWFVVAPDGSAIEDGPDADDDDANGGGYGY